MRIEGYKVPERENCETEIHLCCYCEDAEECEVKECKIKGWCHTYKEV
jgi:hypothetical protein